VYLKLQDVNGIGLSPVRPYDWLCGRYTTRDLVGAPRYQALAGSPQRLLDPSGLRTRWSECANLAHQTIQTVHRRLGAITERALSTLCAQEAGRWNMADPGCLRMSTRTEKGRFARPDIYYPWRVLNACIFEVKHWSHVFLTHGYDYAIAQIQGYIGALHECCCFEAMGPTKPWVEPCGCVRLGATNVTAIEVPGCGQLRWFCIPGGVIVYTYAEESEEPGFIRDVQRIHRRRERRHKERIRLPKKLLKTPPKPLPLPTGMMAPSQPVPWPGESLDWMPEWSEETYDLIGGALVYAGLLALYAVMLGSGTPPEVTNREPFPVEEPTYAPPPPSPTPRFEEVPNFI